VNERATHADLGGQAGGQAGGRAGGQAGRQAGQLGLMLVQSRRPDQGCQKTLNDKRLYLNLFTSSWSGMVILEKLNEI
jgi:hypothetical protein